MGRVALQRGELVAGKYRLERQIGSGGMGVVFAAMHVQLERRVALKFLHEDAAQSAETVERFWHEARAAVKIQSEHVARVMDIGELPSGQPFIVMEYLEGNDLDNIVKASGPLAIGDAIQYLLEACEALAEVHAQGIVHRDIKPANLFIATRADRTSIVKLLDFGVSKAAPSWTIAEGPRSLTSTSEVIGSPRYMSPEQLRSSRDVDARSDIWALGVTLFELLGGRSPFARGSMPEVCASILKDEPLSLTRLRPEVPHDLDAVIRRCLAKEADARYRNVAELAMALRPFGPLGIIDISIERIVGIIQMSLMASTGPADAERERQYLSRIGPRLGVPRLAMAEGVISSLALDHRAGFLLSRIDGASSIDELLDVSGMPRLETLRLLCELVDQGVVALTRPR